MLSWEWWNKTTEVDNASYSMNASPTWQEVDRLSVMMASAEGFMWWMTMCVIVVNE